jgi:hypothetical protein
MQDEHIAKSIPTAVIMVNTRSLQGSTRKRGRSPSEIPSDTGSIKIRKTTARRRFTTADDQLHGEERGASTREPSEQEVIEVAIPTKSRHSLPASLPVPNIKFEPLQVAIARRIERRHRHTEGLVDDVEFAVDANTYVDPEDLNVQTPQLMTPTRRIEYKSTPIRILQRPSPDIKREDNISEYQDTIRTLTEEKAHLEARLRVLELGVRGMGFGHEDLVAEEICAELRVEFDQLRSQEAEMAIDLPIEDLSNQQLLQHQPDIIRGLLQDIDRFVDRMEKIETQLAFTKAEYVNPGDEIAKASKIVPKHMNGHPGAFVIPLLLCCHGTDLILGMTAFSTSSPIERSEIKY